MQRVHTVAEVRAAEADLMSQLPSDELMRRAAFGLAVEVSDLLRERFGAVSGSRVVGLIGAGNNGSDTLWCLALLAGRGVGVSAVDATGARRPDHTDELFRRAGGSWDDLVDSGRAHLYLDGIAGLGSNRAVDVGLLDFLAVQQSAGALVVAVDLPSGLDADAAKPVIDGAAVEADVSVTFGCLKPCHVLDPALEHCGEVRVVDIGLDPYLPRPHIHAADDSFVAALWPTPGEHDSKYTRGVVNVVAGSKKYPGAGLLAARAARWGGAGMVRHVGAGAVFEAGSAAIVVQPDSRIGDRADSYVVGPGLGKGKRWRKVVKAALKTAGCVVLDATALNLLADSGKLRERLRTRHGPTLLTPHGGEFARLLSGYGIDLSLPGPAAALALAAASGAVVYLKGSVGVVATPTGDLIATRRTSEHLSTAGTGDVLAGLVGSLIAAGKPADDWMLALYCAAAVIVHSLAAEIVVDDGEPLTADELEEELPAALADLLA